MPTRHTGPHALNGMMMEYHYHPFGDNHLAAQRVVSPLPEAFDTEKRLDYDTREDENPVYIAFAEYVFTSETAAITPAESDTWIIQKLTYDSDSRLTRIQVARGSWTDRASLFS